MTSHAHAAHRTLPKALVTIAGSALWLLSAAAGASNVDEELHATRWQQLRSALFQDRAVKVDESVISITAPMMAGDPASVPVTISTAVDELEDRYVKSVTLLVDHNPSPLAAVFNLGPRIGAGAISTRVRVNEFSYIRAVAETSDGELYMAKSFVKAHGGCDVPPLKDHAQIEKTLGNMKLSLPGGAMKGESSIANLAISHPNYNGMQVSNTAGVYLPARLVKTINIRYAQELVMGVDGHLSLSQDPRIRFTYLPERSGKMSVEVVDSDSTRFQQDWLVDVLGATN